MPLGVLLLFGARAVGTSGPRRGALPDVVGTLLLATGVGFISLSIVQGSAWGWASARTLGVAATGLLLLAWALRRSARQAVPAVETQLWRIRTFALANIVSLFYGAALYAWLLEGVLFLVNVSALLRCWTPDLR